MTRPLWWGEACRELAAHDAVMAGLMARFPDSALVSRGEPLQTLLRAIVGQQISTRAADAVWGRFVQRIVPEDPLSVLAASDDDLRRAGLSVRKVDYVKDLAAHFADGRLVPDAFAALDDESVIRQLVAVRGIGRWTAEMFLIFNLLRPNVWPVDDIGVQNAVARCYANGERLPLAGLRAFGERFQPWRTVASWYLWRSLDPVDVVY